MKYIDAEKLIAVIDKILAKAEKDEKKAFYKKDANGHLIAVTKTAICVRIKKSIASLQQEQPAMIQWTGNNLKEVIDFTGKSPRFGEWFKSWDEFESYVHSHGDILKLFSEDGSHFEVPVGAWIVKTPDGYNVPSVARFIHTKREQQEVDLFERPETPIKDAVEVVSRLRYIDEDLKPIAEFIMDYASWNLHKDEWNQPTIEVPLFRVLDALAQRGKPYCCSC